MFCYSSVRYRNGVAKSLEGHDNFVLQSSTATLNDNATGEVRMEHENIGFLGESRVNEEGFGDVLDDTIVEDKVGSAELGSFLSRPVVISTVTWPEDSSTLLQASFQPWYAFFNNAQIKKKLDNFAYLKCTLKLKFVINASPFYYGAIGAFYHPLSGWWENLTTPATNAQIQIPVSQRPHVWLNPQEVSTAEMTLPYFNFNNWLDVRSALDFQRFGVMDLWQYSKLRSANGATGAGVTITTYAWAEDVVVAGPSVALALQTKRVNKTSERWWKPSGQISQMASKVSEVTPLLGKMGSVGNYAGKTIDAAANVVGAVSSLFGFTNAPVIEDARPFKPLPFHSLASTEISEPVERLTVDPKQALDVDSSVAGLDGTDELGISYICQKESFLTGTLWADAMPTDRLIFSARVTPELFTTRSSTGGTQLYEAPMSYVSRMFSAWRGDVIFRFKFIRSMYHRGRVRVTWDPTGNIESDTASTTVAYTKIVDLDEDDEVEFQVPYLALTPFLALRGDANVNFSNSTSGVSPTRGFANGLITVRVLNALTGPVVGTELDMLVFVRAAENMEFAAPRDGALVTSPFALQSKTEMITGGRAGTAEGKYGAVYGERYASMRQLLHRSSRYGDLRAYPAVGLKNTTTISWYLSRFPDTFGAAPDGMHLAIKPVGGAQIRYNFLSRHPLTYISQLFVGHRGSVTWHFNADATSGKVVLGNLTAERCSAYPPGSVRCGMVSYDNTAVASQVAFAALARPVSAVPAKGSGWPGTAMTSQHTQAGLSVNVPDYNPRRFRLNDPTSNNADQLYGGEKFALTTTVATSDLPYLSVNTYACAGPDFDFIFFMNTPDNYIGLIANPAPADPAVTSVVVV